MDVEYCLKYQKNLPNCDFSILWVHIQSDCFKEFNYVFLRGCEKVHYLHEMKIGLMSAE